MSEKAKGLTELPAPALPPVAGYEHPSVRLLRRMAEDNGGIIYAEALANAEDSLAYWQQRQASEDPNERQRAVETLRANSPIAFVDALAISATYTMRHTPEAVSRLRKECLGNTPRRIRQQREAEAPARFHGQLAPLPFALPSAGNGASVPPHTLQLAVLEAGTAQQREAHRVSQALNLFPTIASFDPVLVGDIALGFDSRDRRLQVRCSASDFGAFVETMRTRYGSAPGFALWGRRSQGLPALVCRFSASGFRIEVFAQARPTTEQNAFRVTAAAAALLRRAGPAAQSAIRQLRAKDLSTEAALAEYFSLPGIPYYFLLALAGGTESQADAVVARADTLRRHCRYCRLVADRTAPGRVYTDLAAVISIDPREVSPRRVLVLPRRHTPLLADSPSHLESEPLNAQVLEPAYREHLTRLWLALSYVVRQAFPQLQTMGFKWDSENSRPHHEQDMHAHLYNLLLLRGQNPLLPMPGWYMAAYQEDGPAIPSDEQREMARRLRAAMVARGLSHT